MKTSYLFIHKNQKDIKLKINTRKVFYKVVYNAKQKYILNRTLINKAY